MQSKPQVFDCRSTLAVYFSLSSMFLAARSLWMKPFLERYSIASAISWQNFSNWRGSFSCTGWSLLSYISEEGCQWCIHVHVQLLYYFLWHNTGCHAWNFFVIVWLPVMYINMYLNSPALDQVVEEIAPWEVFHDQHNLQMVSNLRDGSSKSCNAVKSHYLIRLVNDSI